jgi:hypothetical protein
MAFTDRQANRGSISTAAYSIDNSVLIDGANCDGQITQTGGDRKTHTISFWHKRAPRGTINGTDAGESDGTSEDLWGTASEGDTLRFNGSRLAFFNEGGTGGQLYTTRVLRDYSAWYHFVIAIDTTQGTAANRIKMYVNGEQQTVFDTEEYPDEDDEFKLMQSGQIFYIGAGHGSTTNPNGQGYYAEFIIVDGAAKAASDFGEFDSDSGIWKPIEYTGDFNTGSGTNGGHYKFEGTAEGTGGSATGIDSSGNSNTINFRNHNGGLTDTPTNNFCTINPIDHPDTLNEISEGNLRATGGQPHSGTMHITSGKWYYEWKVTSFGSGGYTTVFCGLMSYLYPTQAFGDTGGVGNWGYKDPVATAGDPITMAFRLYPGAHYCFKNSNDGASSNSMTGGQDFTFVAGSIIRVCIDYDNGAYWLGVWEGSPDSGNSAYIGGDGTENDGHGWLNHGASAGQSNPATGAYPGIGTGSAGTAQGRSTQDGSQSDASLLTTVPGPVRIWQYVYAGSNNSDVQVNYGNPPYTWSGSSYADANGYGKFQYEPPSGFYALCSKNLAEFG